MFINNIDPVLLRLGGLEIRYYGIIFAVAILMGYFFVKWWAKQGRIKNLRPEQVDDYALYFIVGVVLGARAVYVLFYNFPYYLTNPAEIIAVWKGGLSFHGGLIGAIIAGYLYCRKNKVSLLQLADATSIPVAIGLFFGRIANFINGELYGRLTSVPWCVKFQNADGCRHPSQLYESLKNLFIFGVLWNLKNKKRPDGFLFGMFVVMYSVLRFFIEFFREPDPQLGFVAFGLTMGQILNVIMFAAGLIFIYHIYHKKK